LPLYEYLCRNCGHRFEEIQKFSDPILKRCPKCKKLKLEKLLSAPAVQFKGSGWYVTDYAGKKPGGEKSESGDKEKKSDGGKSGKETSKSKPSKD
jgi:putative FmdB family regulatory protein